jgi:hypothetical protein
VERAKRAAVFEPLGITMRTLRDPAGSNKVGLLAEICDDRRPRSS